jgi:hypothetical protein
VIIHSELKEKVLQELLYTSTFQYDEAENKDILLAKPPGERSLNSSKELMRWRFLGYIMILF